MSERYDASVAAVFVRTTSSSGRMDLAPELVRLLRDLAVKTARVQTPYVVCLFGNPYIATELPSVLLTYDFYDLPEAAAARALSGEIAIGGKLPISLPGLFPVGHGLERPAQEPSDDRSAR